MNLYPQHYDDAAPTTCGDCGHKATARELDPIKDPSDRLSSGDPLPAGECLRCGSLAYVGNHMRDDRLQKFALDVLALLEGDEDWSPSTMDAIGDSARDYELAEEDRHGKFLRRWT
jgi:hypothetical protein